LPGLSLNFYSQDLPAYRTKVLLCLALESGREDILKSKKDGKAKCFIGNIPTALTSKVLFKKFELY
jgi:hypothetical protein